LHRAPRISHILIAIREQGRQIVQDDEAYAVENSFNSCLALLSDEIDPILDVVRRKNPECIVRNVAIEAERDLQQSLLQVRQTHLTIHVKNAAICWRRPPKQI
jgi:hypothetical protein